MPNRRSTSQTSANPPDKNEAAPRRMKPQQWLLLGAGVLGIGAAVTQWAVNNRREQARRQHLDAANERELAMIPLPSQAASLTAAPVSQAPIVTSAASQEMPSALLPSAEMPQMVIPSTVLPSAVPLSAAPAQDASSSSATPAPPSDLPDAALSGTVATKKRTTSKTVQSEPAQTDDAVKPAKATRSASKTTPLAAAEAIPGTAAASGKKKMSNTTGKRSKMSEEFDEALEENTVAGPGAVGGIAQSAVAGMSANAPSSPAASGIASSAPAENALATQAEGKLAVGEELRDREFPVPPQESGAVSQRLVVDQETLSDEGPRPGGVVGTMPGDHQPNGDINDIVDQRSVTPDLPQQKG